MTTLRTQDPMKKLSLKTQFRLGTGIILFLVCFGITLIVYRYQKKHVEENVYKETEIYMAAVEATRTYVKDVLRPQMYAIVPEDHFVVEAMSTSFVGREIMGRVHDRFQNFAYKRASQFPLNPANEADSYERAMIRKLNGDRGIREWSGIIKKDGRSFYARFRSISAERDCLRCHGDPRHVPKVIAEKYDYTGPGYGDRMGEVIAVDSVYIPVDFAMAKIKKQAWKTFIVGGGILFFLTLLFYALFNHTVMMELKGLLTTFRGITDKEMEGAGPDEDPPVDTSDEIGQLKGAFEHVAADLTKKHEALKESESKFRRLFEASRDAIFIWNMDKKNMDINPAGLKMFGFNNRTEALSIETIDQLFWDARDGSRIFEAVQKEGFVREYDVSMTNRWGQRLDVLLTANLLRDENGNADAIQGYIRDVTAKKKLEKHLAQTEKLASIGQLAAGVAHQINNPLGVIKCYAGLIEKSTEQGSQIQSDVGTIKKHTASCSKIVEGLLNFARVSETNKAKADIHKDLEEVLSILELQMTRRKISVRRKYGTHVPQIIIDSDKMKQVYMNLLMNARQAIAGEGEIAIETDYNHEDRTITIIIADSGTGIPSDRIGSIFDPFFTTKKPGEGTGLGLSIAYGIVRDHDGDLQVESNVDKGTRFTIILPVS